MNPILIKPSGDTSSQVVVCGKIWGRVTAADYHQRRVEELLPIVRESYEALASQYDVIILEGAGSPAEINLKRHDIANMRMAEMADARCLLVGDIDRGGVFASLLGTLELLDAEERERIRGFAINKFRGDASLLEPGIRMIEERMRKPCIGVVPYLRSLMLEEEDSLGLPAATQTRWGRDTLSDRASDRPLRVAVIALPSFSNFTDFDSLRAEPSVSVLFCRTAGGHCTMPMSSFCLEVSRQWMICYGCVNRAWMLQCSGMHGRALVMGICGGMQMLGEIITDPLGMERDGSVAGLGLLPIQTIMQADKVTRNVTGNMVARSLFGQPVADSVVSGYEIHIGRTIYQSGGNALCDPCHRTCDPSDDHNDGCMSTDTRFFGTYLHGLFDDDGFRHQFLRAARAFHTLGRAGRALSLEAASRKSR